MIIRFLIFFIFYKMQLAKNKEKIYIKCIQSVKNTLDNNKLQYISNILFEAFDDWIFCCFYFQEQDELIISEYKANKLPCSPIGLDGVCGTSIVKNQILNIKDVYQFEGHIVCDENSKSELCIPFEINSTKYVLDIDSKKMNAFCEIDEKYLLKIVKEI